MADIATLTVDNKTYDIKDAAARSGIDQLQDNLDSEANARQEDSAFISKKIADTTVRLSEVTVAANAAAAAANKLATSAITGCETQYAVTSSGETAPFESDWTSETPHYREDMYTWMRQVFSYGDGTTQVSNPVMITAFASPGAQGEQGAAGASVTDITIVYYSSTSQSKPVGGKWQADLPTWQKGRYIWIKVITTVGDEAVESAPTFFAAFDNLSSEVSSMTSELKSQKKQLNSISATNSSLSSQLYDFAGTIDNLQTQWDASNATYCQSGEPTLDNYPANTWTTTSEMLSHVGDVYYDSDNGLTYRFVNKGSGLFGWYQIVNSDITAALDAANSAQNAAAGKNKIFVSKPEPPYNAGDLWVQGAGGDIMRCVTSRSEGDEYHAADWTVASGYTDDTAANAAQLAADAAQLKAEEAVATAEQAAAEIRAEVAEAKQQADAAQQAANEAQSQLDLQQGEAAEIQKNLDALTKSMDETTSTLGKTVLSTILQFAYTSDKDADPQENDWSTSASKYDSTKYLWVRQIITYGNGDSKTTDPIMITGDTGKVNDGQYIHIAYANDANGSSDFSTSTGLGRAYIGFYSGIEETAPVAPEKYSWSLIRGMGRTPTVTVSKDTEKGVTTITTTNSDGTVTTQDISDGIAGTPGKDGTSQYVHIKYSDDGEQFTEKDGETPGNYIGIRVDSTEEDSLVFSDYDWKLIKGEQGIQGLQGDKGEKGIDGTSVSITDNTVQYAVSDSGTEIPADSEWKDEQQEPQPGKYSWVKTTVIYSSGQSTTAYSVAYQGTAHYTWIKYADDASGRNMSDSPVGKAYIGFAYNKDTSIESSAASDYEWSLIKGSDGEIGNGIKSVTNYYATTGTQEKPDADKITDPVLPVLSAAKKYLWRKEVIEFTQTDTPQVTITLAGTYGDKGEPGDKTYFHIKYSSVENPTTADQMSETPDVYIGTYVDSVEEDSTDPRDYDWCRFQGAQGEKGEQGIQGKKGEDGTTQYLHIAYANDDQGTDFSVSDYAGRSYIGQYVDEKKIDSTEYTSYKWSKIKGEQGDKGDSVTSITTEYYSSTSKTEQKGGKWQPDLPEWKKDYYIWQRTVSTIGAEAKYSTPTLYGVYDGLGSAVSDLKQQATDFSNALVSIDGNITTLQNQVDGVIETWFSDGEPTLSNSPAKDWEDSTAKERHLGDLYYDNKTGYGYRFSKDNDTYSWVRIADSAVVKALEDAAAAQDTADGKRTVFVDTPTPPYDIGDLWVQGSNGDILYCTTAKSKGGIYSADDWLSASKYTDDTKAKEALGRIETAEQNITNVKERLITAESDASTAAETAAKTAQLAVIAVKYEYTETDSATIKPGSTNTWYTSDKFTHTDGKFTWMRTTLTHGDNKVGDPSDPVLITGSAGENGDQGISVTSFTTFYILATEQPKTPEGTADPSGWSTTEPTPEKDYSGKMWRTERTIFSNNVATWTSPTSVASFEYASAAYQAADGVATKYKKIEDTVKEYNKTYGTTYETIDGALLEMASNIKQNSEGIELSATKDYVEKNYETQEDAANLGVGGRNILLGTKDWSQGMGADAIKLENETYSNCSIIYGTGSTSAYKALCQWSVDNAEQFAVAPTASATYTLSFWAKATEKCSIESYFIPSIVTDTTGSVKQTCGTSWQRYRAVWTIKDSYDSAGQMIVPVEIVPGTTATVYVAGVKLERGSQATDWTPALEDTTAEISHSVSSALAVYDNQIKGEINDKYQIKGDYPTTGQMNTAISQSRIAIESSVSDTYYTKSDADDLSATLSKTSTLVTQTKNAIDTTFTNTIVDNSVAYAVSSKSTSVNSKTPPDDVKDSDWGTEIKWESGKYTWQRTTVTKANVKYDDSKKAYVSNPETVKTYVCIQGAKGDKGDTGAGFQWNLVSGTSSEWSDWITPDYNKTNQTGTFYKLKLPKFDVPQKFARQIEIEFSGVTATEGKSFDIYAQGEVNGRWDQYNPWSFIFNLKTPPADGVYQFSSIRNVPEVPDTDTITYALGYRCDYWASGKFRYRCVKIEMGDTATPWCTTQAETIGAKGDKGDKGDDAVSPTITTSQENGVTKITVTDVNGSNTYEVKDGTDGTSVEVSSSTITYQAGASGTAAPTGTWYDTVEKANAQKGQYLWTKTVVTYSDGKNSESYSVSYIANDGVNGTSIGIKSKSVTYQQGDNGTTAPTGEWLQSIPNVPAGKFLWTKTEVIYDDKAATKTEAYSVSYIGTDGNAGKGISSITEYYAKSSSNTTAPDTTSSSWKTTVQTTDATDKYLWNYEEIQYTDKSTPFKSTPHVIGTYSEDGVDGVGISGVTNYYLATSASSGVTAKTSGWTTTIQTIDATNKYLWNYEITTYTNSKTSSTTPCIIGTYGETAYVHVKYSNDGTSFTPATSDKAEGETPGSWIGQYTDHTKEDSTTFADYNWQKIKGEDGVSPTITTSSKDGVTTITITDANGKQNPITVKDGVDGTSTYLYYAYCNLDSSGNVSDFSLSDPSGRKYIGICSSQSSTKPSTADSYKPWSKMVGEDGYTPTVTATKNSDGSVTITTVNESGKDTKTIPAGQDGVSSYLHVKYSNDNGKTFTDNNGEDPGDYIAILQNNTEKDPDNISAYTGLWKKITGEDGTKLVSSVVQYATSTDGQNPPTSWGKENVIPSVSSGQYLWTRTANTYDNAPNDPIYIYSVSYKPKELTKTSTVIKYADGGTNGSTAPTSGWQDTAPAVDEGHYLWTKTTNYFSDGTNSSSYACAKQGVSGTNGTTYYTWIKYADENKAGATLYDTPAGHSYMGIATKKTVEQESNSWSDYKWTKFKGEDGADGINFQWNLLKDTATPITVTDNSNLFNQSSSSYHFANGKNLYQGALELSTTYTVRAKLTVTGTVASTAAYRFLFNDSPTTIDSSYHALTSGEQMVEYTFTTASSYDSTAISDGLCLQFQNLSTGTTITITEMKLEKGSIASEWCTSQAETVGTGIKNFAYSYLATSSQTQPAAADVKDDLKTATAALNATNRYLWQKETITSTEDTTLVVNVTLSGVYGDTGDAGKGISSITEHYAYSTSNTEVTGSWQNTPPTLDATNKYLWNYETIAYTKGDPLDTKKRVIGMYSEDGTDGAGISGITNYYLATSVDSGVTTKTSGWSTDPATQTVSAAKKYLWNYEHVTYTNGKESTDTDPCVIGMYSEDGTRGFSILKITTAPTAYTTTVGTFTPAYRIALSTVKTQSSATEVLVGDVLQYSYYQYKVGYVDASYVYTAASSSIRGATGATGYGMLEQLIRTGWSDATWNTYGATDYSTTWTRTTNTQALRVGDFIQIVGTSTEGKAHVITAKVTTASASGATSVVASTTAHYCANAGENGTDGINFQWNMLYGTSTPGTMTGRGPTVEDQCKYFYTYAGDGAPTYSNVFKPGVKYTHTMTVTVEDNSSASVLGYLSVQHNAAPWRSETGGLQYQVLERGTKQYTWTVDGYSSSAANAIGFRLDYVPTTTKITVNNWMCTQGETASPWSISQSETVGKTPKTTTQLYQWYLKGSEDGPEVPESDDPNYEDYGWTTTLSAPTGTQKSKGLVELWACFQLIYDDDKTIEYSTPYLDTANTDALLYSPKTYIHQDDDGIWVGKGVDEYSDTDGDGTYTKSTEWIDGVRTLHGVTGFQVWTRETGEDGTVTETIPTKVEAGKVTLGVDGNYQTIVASDGIKLKGFTDTDKKTQADLVSIQGNGITLGLESGFYNKLNSTGMHLYQHQDSADGDIEWASFNVNAITLGQTGDEDYNTRIETTGIHLRKGETDLVTLKQDSLVLGKLEGDSKNIVYNTYIDSAGIKFQSNDGDTTSTLGQINASGLTFYSGNNPLMQLKTNEIVIGSETAGYHIHLDSTGQYLRTGKDSGGNETDLLFIGYAESVAPNEDGESWWPNAGTQLRSEKEILGVIQKDESPLHSQYGGLMVENDGGAKLFRQSTSLLYNQTDSPCWLWNVDCIKGYTYISTSGTTLQGGEWKQASVRDVSDGQYVWMKAIVTYLDGSDPIESSPVLVFPNSNLPWSTADTKTTITMFWSAANSTDYFGGVGATYPEEKARIIMTPLYLSSSSSRSYHSFSLLSIDPVQTRLEAIKGVKVLWRLSTSSLRLLTSTSVAGTWHEGAAASGAIDCYVWIKTVVSYNDGTPDLESRPICISPTTKITAKTTTIQPIYAQESSCTFTQSALTTITTSPFTPTDGKYIYTGVRIDSVDYIAGCWEGAKLYQVFDRQKANWYSQLLSESSKISLTAKQVPYYNSSVEADPRAQTVASSSLSVDSVKIECSASKIVLDGTTRINKAITVYPDNSMDLLKTTTTITTPSTLVYSSYPAGTLPRFLHYGGRFRLFSGCTYSPVTVQTYWKQWNFEYYWVLLKTTRGNLQWVKVGFVEAYGYLQGTYSTVLYDITSEGTLRTIYATVTISRTSSDATTATIQVTHKLFMPMIGYQYTQGNDTTYTTAIVEIHGVIGGDHANDYNCLHS